jgi:hypothetical protein
MREYFENLYSNTEYVEFDKFLDEFYPPKLN